MTIRGLTVSLLFAVLAAPAYAQDSDPTPPQQDNPETRQTDQSEDDYRRSQRRRGIEDIFEDIDINTRGSGTGTILGREVKAIDRLDPESRRHLNKQRAKALAEAQPGEPIDAAYEPSETAKSDEYVAKQEEAAWQEMMEEANSGLNGIQGQGGGSGGGSGGGQGSQAGQAGNGQPGQNGQGQSGASQGQAGQGQSSQGQAGQGQGGQSQGNPSAGQPSSSPLRGGSASSAASILDQIKGRSGSSNRAGQQNNSGGAQSGSASQAGQNGPKGQAPQNASAQSGQSQSDAQASSDANSDNRAAAQAATQNNAQAQAQAQAQAEAQAQAAAEAKNDAAHASAHREALTPLERLKRESLQRDDEGGRTSASDYLKRKKN